MNRQELKKNSQKGQNELNSELISLECDFQHAWNTLLTNLGNGDRALQVHYIIEFASHRKDKKTTFSKNTSVPEFVFQVMLGWKLAIFE